MSFEPGDVVQLKSGGPAMMVKEIGTLPYREEEGVWCIWFEQVGPRQEIKQDAFAPITLRKLEEVPGSIRIGRR